jgi:hypothetical protein
MVVLYPGQICKKQDLTPPLPERYLRQSIFSFRIRAPQQPRSAVLTLDPASGLLDG